MTKREFEKHSFSKGDLVYSDQMECVAEVSAVDFENDYIQLQHPETKKKFWYHICHLSFVTCGSCRLMFCPGQMPAKACLRWTPDE